MLSWAYYVKIRVDFCPWVHDPLDHVILVELLHHIGLSVTNFKVLRIGAFIRTTDKLGLGKLVSCIEVIDGHRRGNSVFRLMDLRSIQIHFDL